MKRKDKHILLTVKEAELAMYLLYTLESMGGCEDDEINPDPQFDKDCKRARNMANKLWRILHYDTLH